MRKCLGLGAPKKKTSISSSKSEKKNTQINSTPGLHHNVPLNNFQMWKCWDNCWQTSSWALNKMYKDWCLMQVLYWTNNAIKYTVVNFFCPVSVVSLKCYTCPSPLTSEQCYEQRDKVATCPNGWDACYTLAMDFKNTTTGKVL